MLMRKTKSCIEGSNKKSKKKLLLIIIIIALIVGGWFLFNYFRDNNTNIKLNKLPVDTTTLNCAVFDGKEVWENSTVVIQDGVISEETVLKKGEVSSEYFLMPGLIDAHAHISTPNQMEQFVKNGVTTVCDVSASGELEDSYKALNVWSSRSMIWMDVDDAENYVKNTLAQGGKYIKVVADLPKIMGGGTMDEEVLREIVRCAHNEGLKVAVHAISVDGIQMAVDCGVDLLIHIPIGEEFPHGLAEQISEKKIAVMPTLVMMKAFAESPFYGYKDKDYDNAKDAVALLHSMDVPILVATDSSDSFFVPKLKHGESIHQEMELLVEAGLTPIEVLQGATNQISEAFEIDDAGTITPGMKATMVLVKGRPDKKITDSSQIVQIWVDGKTILENTVRVGAENMNNDELKFYPKHPSSLKTHKIETRPMPILEQDEPFYAKELCNEFSNDLEGALAIYEDKRFEVTGIASKIGPDIHNKPSIEISDEVGGQCYTLCIFPTDDFYKEVSVGDKVTVRANYLVMSNWYGVVMKYSDLVKVGK